VPEAGSPKWDGFTFFRVKPTGRKRGMVATITAVSKKEAVAWLWESKIEVKLTWTEVHAEWHWQKYPSGRACRCDAREGRLTRLRERLAQARVDAAAGFEARIAAPVSGDESSDEDSRERTGGEARVPEETDKTAPKRPAQTQRILEGLIKDKTFAPTGRRRKSEKSRRTTMLGTSTRSRGPHVAGCGRTPQPRCISGHGGTRSRRHLTG